MLMSRAIVHMDLDTFFVSCERLNNDELNNIPLLIGGSRERGVVACASRESRRFGVHAGMPMRLALRLCPDAKVLKGDFDLYSNKSREVTEIIQEESPLFEKSSIDEFYLDISGLDQYFGCLQWSSELSSRIVNETGLPITFGLSVNKTVSKMATNEAKPTGIGKLQVKQEQIRSFLDPLSIIKIPSLGNSTYKTLSRIGIRTIKTLSEVPTEMLEKLLGKNGHTLSLKANGIDNSPVKPHTERKSLSKERTFHHDTIDVKKLKTILSHLVEQLCFQLRDEQWLTSSISVKIRYSNFDTHSKQANITLTSCDKTLQGIAMKLFESVYERRMRLRLIGVKFGKLKRGYYQINAFDDTEKKVSLYQAMDRIKRRDGTYAVQWCSGFHQNKTTLYAD